MALQYGVYALRVGLAKLYARMRTHTPKCKHAHTGQYVTLIAFPQQQWLPVLLIYVQTNLSEVNST
jgi:hypothetical protein